MSMDFGHFIAAMEARRQAAASELATGRSRKRDGMVLLSSEFGLWDHLWLPGRLVYADGRHNLKHIDRKPSTMMHNCQAIPAYDDIPAAVRLVTAACDDKAHRLGGLGISIESKGHKALGFRIRGLMRAIWLYHLWNGDDVSQLRGRFYHPDDVKRYWPLAWAMHGKDSTLADALAYLRSLCVEYAARTQKAHAGEASRNASQALLNKAA